MLPDFSGPVTGTQPPFQFSNVMVSTFPLRAQLDSLQRFCDSYLNMVPPEVGYFRASMPYVMLMLLDYGKLAAQATNFGWFSQREVLFSVPVEWYKFVDGRWLFHDWASVTPFVYVDAEMSMTLGRTGMGWPKSLVKLSPQLTGWLRDPTGSTVDLAISARVFANAYAGARMEEQPVMVIRSPPPVSFQLPFNTESPLLPWTMLANTARSVSSLFSDYLGALNGMGIAPLHEGSTPENALRKLRKMASMGAQSLPWAPRLDTNSVNLKQFRRADAPEHYCYQGLTNGPMRITAFNRGGMFGSTFGDPSGGYTIDLACFPNFPVVDTLGLDAAYIRLDGAPTIARLQPVMPFWYDVNMEYQKTDTLAWRTGMDPIWRDQGREYEPESAPSLAFNTVTGASSPVITGPFHFASATITVLPLLARSAVLDVLLEKLLNTPLASTGEVFTVWGDTGDGHAYIYLCATDAGSVSSETNNIGDWGDLSLSFYIPVLRWVDGKVVGSGMVPAHVFAAGTTQACTLSELYGVPAIEADFTRLAHEWDGLDEAESRSLIRVDAMSLPALNEGEEARVCSLLEIIDRGAGDTVDEPLSHSADEFCRLLRKEVARKYEDVSVLKKQSGRTRALDVMALGKPLHVYTMKQFRDAGSSEQACYQALVQIPYVLEEVQQLEELERLVCVDVRKRASFSIVDDLGLVARDMRTEDGAIVHRLEAVRPFRLKAELSMGNGRELFSRADLTWQPHHELESSRGSNAPLLPASAEKYVSKQSCTHLKRSVAEWLDEQTRELGKSIAHPSTPGELPLSESISLLSVIDPQAVIETILSREWEDRSTRSTRAETRDSLKRAMVRDEAGWGSWLADNLGQLDGMNKWDRELVHWLHRLELLCLKLDRLQLAVAEHRGDALIGDELSDAERLPLAQQEKFPELENIASTREQQALELLHAKWQRAIERYRGEDASNHEAWAAVAGATRELLRELYPLAERRLDDAIDLAVAKRRKPDHCVPRSTAGSDRDRLFPLLQSWDVDWYDGRLVTERTPSQRPPPGPVP